MHSIDNHSAEIGISVREDVDTYSSPHISLGASHLMNEKPARSSSTPTSYENFLYLLAEMERSVDIGDIQWPANAADWILGRLGRIAQKVALALDGHRSDKMH
jgi:hypothetical protein